jgi:diguanylate cyclase (GGDEF)-like protein/PAS domain S-box-containing protein
LEAAFESAQDPLVVHETGTIVRAHAPRETRTDLADAIRVQALALEAAASGIVITDRAGIITWANPAFCRMSGYAQHELLGQHTRILRSGKHGCDFYSALWHTVLEGRTWTGELVNRRKDGTEYLEEQTIAPVHDATRNITHFIAIKQDITARREAEHALERAHVELAQKLAEIEHLNAKLNEQALRDPLTGLYNRRFFHASMERELARVRRESVPLSLVLVDLDHFKQINDTYGHAAGDAVLKHVANLLVTHSRSSDLACRMGGEEFVVVLPGASLQAARMRADAWRELLGRQIIPTGDKAVRVTLSAGVASLRDGSESTDVLLARADEALYRAKRGGRDSVMPAE